MRKTKKYQCLANTCKNTFYGSIKHHTVVHFCSSNLVQYMSNYNYDKIVKTRAFGSGSLILQIETAVWG